MKQKPETRPNREILNSFLHWAGVLKRPVEDCLTEAFNLYKNNPDASKEHEIALSAEDWKTFTFEIDLIGWSVFKNYALRNNNHDRDQALTLAMSYFNDKYNQILSGAF